MDPDISRPRAPDASMDLLNQIVRQPVDPDYAIAAARGDRPPRARWTLTLVAVVIGAMFAVAALQTSRSEPALRTERSELITRVRAAETEQDRLRLRANEVQTDITRLRAAALGEDSTAGALQGQINALEPGVGTVPVTGPGVVIMVDDAPSDTGDARDRVLDLDLQVLVNGLWQSGAEAVAINGHRLSTLVAIRSAGSAITVDYRSLNRPYRIEAIGNSQTLEATLAESPAGAWWHELSQNRQMPYEVSTVKTLTLDADPGMVLRHAKKAGS